MVRRLGLSLISLAFVLTACGAEATPTDSPAAPTATPVVPSFEPTQSPSSTASPTPTVAPTPSPSPLPLPTPTPGPTPRPTPRPTSRPTPAPTATAWSTTPSTYIASGSRDSGEVALTFDFGGRIGDALAIVTYLRDHGIHATVFATGKQVALAGTTTGDGPTVKSVLGVVCPDPAQFAFGNHSYTHTDFPTLISTPDQMRWELLETENVDQTYCHRTSRPYFRPPDGALGGWQTAAFKTIMAVVGSVGFSKTIFWDVDTLDWAAPGSTYYQTAAMIEAKVQSKVQSGSIVLMHLGGYNTLAALPTVIANIRAKGLRLVTLDELLGG